MLCSTSGSSELINSSVVLFDRNRVGRLFADPAQRSPEEFGDEASAKSDSRPIGSRLGSHTPSLVGLAEPGAEWTDAVQVDATNR